MATYVELNTLLRVDTNPSTPEEQGRVWIAISESARDVQLESPTVTDHTSRLHWANTWLAGRDKSPFVRYMYLVLENSTIRTNITTDGTSGDVSLGTTTDNDLKFVTDGLVNTFFALP